MWDIYLVIPKYIVPPHPTLVETSEKNSSAIQTLWHPENGEKNPFAAPF